MEPSLSFGEVLRRLRRQKRWGLADVSAASGISIAHLSRLENDAVLPSPATVVKLAEALEGDLEELLQLANCLPAEIMERLLQRVAEDTPALRRAATSYSPDEDFARALLEDLDPSLRRRVAEAYGLPESDVTGLFTVLRQMARADEGRRMAFIHLFTQEDGGSAR